MIAFAGDAAAIPQGRAIPAISPEDYLAEASSLFESTPVASLDSLPHRRVSVAGTDFRMCLLQTKPISPTGGIVIVLLPEDNASTLVVSTLRTKFRLTRRETEVALLLARRRSNKEIAKELGVQLCTAERHTEKVLAKLSVGSRREVESVVRKLSLLRNGLRS